MSQKILCDTCKNREIFLETSLCKGAKQKVDCYFPANNRKVDKATECEEYEEKEDND